MTTVNNLWLLTSYITVFTAGLGGGMLFLVWYGYRQLKKITNDELARAADELRNE